MAREEQRNRDPQEVEERNRQLINTYSPYSYKAPTLQPGTKQQDIQRQIKSGYSYDSAKDSGLRAQFYNEIQSITTEIAGVLNNLAQQKKALEDQQKQLIQREIDFTEEQIAFKQSQQEQVNALEKERNDMFKRFDSIIALERQIDELEEQKKETAKEVSKASTQGVNTEVMGALVQSATNAYDEKIVKIQDEIETELRTLELYKTYGMGARESGSTQGRDSIKTDSQGRYILIDPISGQQRFVLDKDGQPVYAPPTSTQLKQQQQGGGTTAREYIEALIRNGILDIEFEDSNVDPEDYLNTNEDELMDFIQQYTVSGPGLGNRFKDVFNAGIYVTNKNIEEFLQAIQQKIDTGTATPEEQARYDEIISRIEPIIVYTRQS